jgi:hypothetical protein
VKALSSYPFSQGLSNQKLVIAGLISQSAASAQPIHLPRLVDYFFGRSTHPELPFCEVFSADSFAEEVAAVGIRIDHEGADSEYLNPHDLFVKATGELSNAKRSGALSRRTPACLGLGALRPTPKTQAIVSQIATDLRTLDVTVGLQLRIEKDWLSYVDKQLSQRPNVERQLTTHIDILRKVYNTFENTIRRIYVSCNESDLPIDKRTIAREAQELFGYELVWKSDFFGLLDAFSYLEQAMVDFEISQLLEKYIGLTRSTFFNVAATTHFARHENARCNVYC